MLEGSSVDERMKVLDDARDARFYDYLELASRVRGGAVTPCFGTDGGRFVYATGEPGERTFHEVDLAAGTSRALFDVERLRAALARHLSRPPAGHGIPFDAVELLTGGNVVRGVVEGRWFDVGLGTDDATPTSARAVLDAERRRPRELRPAAAVGDSVTFEVPSPDGAHLLTERDHDLWLRAVADDRLQRLTEDGEPDRPWLADGALWAPDGLRLVARRVDRRQMRRVPVVHSLGRHEQVEWVPFARPGEPIERPALFVLDVLTGRRTRLETLSDDPELLLAPVAWLPARGELLFVTLDRLCKAVRLLAADAGSGRARVVAEEGQDTFVRLAGDEDIAANATVLADGEHVLWYSTRGEWRHVYLYGVDGVERGQVTSGEFDVESIVGVDERGGRVFFLARSDPARPYDVHVCRASLDGSDVRQLTRARGVHAAELALDGEHLIDTHSELARAPSVDLLDADGRELLRLSEADTSGLDELGYRPGEAFTVLAADGATELHGVLYTPPGFDPQRSYPLVEWVYGGPQSIEHQVEFLGRGAFAQALAQLGFVTYAVDGRGTPGRGKSFQDVGYGRFGRFHVEDHVHALRQLLDRHAFLDAARVGVVGGSWGGYNVVRSMLLAPELYRVGVALMPVGDLWDDDFRIELFMGCPRANRAAYDDASCSALADRLEGRLLLIGGTSDVNVPIAAVLKLVDAFARAGKPVDVLPLPEQDHGLGAPHGEYALAAAARYFVEQLAP
ncbi:MAG TPA: DPP IV N-terminal domain-containing protein [Conexibacter sp.]|nr:DPP IV N-terminal domain-containing protein [Conexibacter sp.]